ncbi:AAA family ATPase [Streptosporangium subroseum]|uniref:dTMP kinase n=1 Tax=Streptosporangium subroseum TaxID=106412 RepID=UPI00344680E0
MITRISSSDPLQGAPSIGALIVLEGMPGAGKTTLAEALATAGERVLGEYTGSDLATVAPHDHPAVDDDAAHQENWLRKTIQSRHISGDGSGPVYVDRDWLSSLSYAYSIGDTDQQKLLTERATWALEQLRVGALCLPDLYLVFDLDIATSLRRRSGMLDRGHPWSGARALRRLRAFYRHPARALSPACPGLATALRTPRWVFVSGNDDRHHVVERARALGGHR